MRVPLWLCLAAVAGLATVVRGTDGVAGCLLVLTHPRSAKLPRLLYAL